MCLDAHEHVGVFFTLRMHIFPCSVLLPLVYFFLRFFPPWPTFSTVHSAERVGIQCFMDPAACWVVVCIVFKGKRRTTRMKLELGMEIAKVGFLWLPCRQVLWEIITWC